VAQKHLLEDVETLETGDKILWIGSRTAGAVVVYFHGMSVGPARRQSNSNSVFFAQCRACEARYARLDVDG
jgi:hypothetical protein